MLRRKTLFMIPRLFRQIEKIRMKKKLLRCYWKFSVANDAYGKVNKEFYSFQGLFFKVSDEKNMQSLLMKILSVL